MHSLGSFGGKQIPWQSVSTRQKWFLLLEHRPFVAPWEITQNPRQGVGAFGSHCSPSSMRPLPQLWRRLSVERIGLALNGSRVSLVPKTVPRITSETEEKRSVGRRAYCARGQ